MKRVIGILFMTLVMMSLCGCLPQSAAKNFGGTMELVLEPNEKLEEITWKDNSLWYLTKEMTDDDVAETHLFREQSATGIWEGTVTIIENKASPEEIEEYTNWKESFYVKNYKEYLIYKNHGYTADDFLYGRVDYSILNQTNGNEDNNNGN